MSNRRRRPLKLYTCAWCGQRKKIEEMRHPGVAKGKAPSTCLPCREAHSAESWCDHHAEPHSIKRFTPYPGDRPGFFPYCKDAASLRAARRRGKEPRACQSCGVMQESWFFRGGRCKSPVCRSCEDGNSGARWCVDCRAWLPEALFNRTGHDGRFWTVRCKPCKAAYAHGTTVAEILRIQGSTHPECASCGSTDDLKVDHDHGCCPASQSSGCCIRGYLCHECNTAEGLLKSPQRALALAAYMSRIAEREGVSNLKSIA